MTLDWAQYITFHSFILSTFNNLISARVWRVCFCTVLSMLLSYCCVFVFSFRNAFNCESINRFLSNSCSNIMNRWIENWSNSLVYLVKKYSSQININIRLDFPYNFTELPLNFTSVRGNSQDPFGEETRCVFYVYLTFLWMPNPLFSLGSLSTNPYYDRNTWSLRST